MEVIQSLLTIEQPTKGDDTNAMDVSEPITIGQFAQTNRSTIHLGLNALRQPFVTDGLTFLTDRDWSFY
uniref:Uncharacterized protein n=1 Tax=Parascaris equorum TaxID=6256 RepID=A0A914RMI7_PAREQ